ncbi:hypothetical protein PoB_002143300 [Plakobranchus ocellatus]|uniref:Uncharacterized protein n=1 Tax=Plakobranchus ocellatus TaxID=259542 RepID=A0AAV3ZKA1_9GAST|nr:hypothetical protein PoB_002143300 [Plakobranchus ocellatus]
MDERCQKPEIKKSLRGPTIHKERLGFFCVCVCKASPHQVDLRLLGPPSGQGAGNVARTRDRRIPADLRADSLTTVPPTSPINRGKNKEMEMEKPRDQIYQQKYLQH